MPEAGNICSPRKQFVRLHDYGELACRFASSVAWTTSALTEKSTGAIYCVPAGVIRLPHSLQSLDSLPKALYHHGSGSTNNTM
jgi:hypothetical protein